MGNPLNLSVENIVDSSSLFAGFFVDRGGEIIFVDCFGNYYIKERIGFARPIGGGWEPMSAVECYPEVWKFENDGAFVGKVLKYGATCLCGFMLGKPDFIIILSEIQWWPGASGQIDTPHFPEFEIGSLTRTYGITNFPSPNMEKSRRQVIQNDNVAVYNSLNDEGNIEITIAGKPNSTNSAQLKMRIRSDSDHNSGFTVEMDGPFTVKARSNAMLFTDVESEHTPIANHPLGVINPSDGDGNLPMIADVEDGDNVMESQNKTWIKSGSIFIGSGDMSSSIMWHLVVWERLKAWLNAHTHPTPGGPSSPPLIPAPDTIRNEQIKVN